MVTARKLRIGAALLAAPLLGGSACGNLLQSSTSREFVAATLIDLPPVANPQQPAQKSPEVVALNVFFGSIDFGDLNPADPGALAQAKPPVGLAGANVSLSFHSARQQADVLLPVDGQPNAPGDYAVTSAQQPQLDYEQGVTYTVTIVWGGDTFTALLTPGQPVAVKEFESEPVQSHSASQDFTLTRDPPSNADIAFVNVAKLDLQDPANPQNITYTTLPQAPLQLLQLVAQPAPWEAPTFTVPAAQAFPQAGQSYLVTLTPVSRGVTSPNLFIGSVALAGSASGGVLRATSP